jgi:hypothetical protein
MPSKRERAIAEAQVGTATAKKRFVPTAASESIDLLINRDLDAAGRIRVVSDQNLRMSCEPDSVWKSYSKQKRKNRKC